LVGEKQAGEITTDKLFFRKGGGKTGVREWGGGTLGKEIPDVPKEEKLLLLKVRKDIDLLMVDALGCQGSPATPLGKISSLEMEKRGIY